MSEDQMAVAYYINALQLLEQYSAKEDDVKSHLATLLFKDYQPLTLTERMKLIESINSSIANHNIKSAVSSLLKYVSVT